MPAISNLSAGQGFVQGFQVADQYLNNQEQLEQRRSAIQSSREQQQFQNDLATKSNARADESMALQRSQLEAQQADREANTELRRAQIKNLDSDNARADRSLAITEANARRQKVIDDYDLSAKERDRLKQTALQHAQIAMNGGSPFPIELHEKLVKGGMPALSPYSFMDQNFIGSQQRLGGIIQAVQSGNLATVNEPENLAALNEAYADQISKGVGDFNSAMGGKVVSKRISKLDAGPGGSVVAHVQVHLDNGKTYEAPMTVARSHDKDDPVKMHDAGTMIDDVVARYQMANMAQNPQFQQSIRQMFNAANSASLSGGKGHELPANAQMIEYLTTRGVPFDEAKDMVLRAVDNPEKAAREFAGVILKNQDPLATDKITPEQAYQQAKQIFAQSTAPAAPPARQPTSTRPGAQATTGQQSAPLQIRTDDDYNALPDGAEYIAPDGSHRRKASRPAPNNMMTGAPISSQGPSEEAVMDLASRIMSAAQKDMRPTTIKQAIQQARATLSGAQQPAAAAAEPRQGPGLHLPSAEKISAALDQGRPDANNSAFKIAPSEEGRTLWSQR